MRWGHLYRVCFILGQTAEDILQRNPRFPTMAKNLLTFFSLGPVVVPLAAFLENGALADVCVATVRNGEEVHASTVGDMTYSPTFLVSFLSQVMALHPGDFISTGTPGAAAIEGGDVVECRIEGLPTLLSIPLASFRRARPVGLSFECIGCR